MTIVGGAISSQTDTLTTLVVKLTRQGQPGLSLLVGAVLLFIALIVNIFLTRLQADRGKRKVQERVTGYVS